MKKDVADKVEELTLQPLAAALRTKLSEGERDSDSGNVDVTVYNEPRLTKDGKIDHATWLVCRYYQDRTEVVFRILDDPPSSDAYGVWQWGNGGRFVLPVPPGEGGPENRADNAISEVFISQAADRICDTRVEWRDGPPPEFLSW